MAYDFTTSPLILQHFCHFTNPPLPPPPAAPTQPIHPSTLPLRPHRAHSFFIPISLPFVIISQLICLTVSIPRASGSYPQGVSLLALHRPLQTCNTPRAPQPPPKPRPHPLSPQCMRDASWRKQREMGPITALGTESWLINSNSLTNCFFTKNHLSLSHGTHIHEKLH